MKTKKRKIDDDSTLDAKKHAELLDNVLSLHKKPQLKKPTRTEPTLQISEFNLVKSITGQKGAVLVDDLTKVLTNRAKHVDISRKIKKSGQKAKTLAKPLEKPKAQKIRRVAAFENVKKQLERWDAVVSSNRAASHLQFPLRTDVNIEGGKKFQGFRLKTDLQKKLEALQPKVAVFNLEKESKYPLTMQEMLERRKEMAKMRAIQSYKEAKARRQSKIKSKKFHRIERRVKVKKQLKDFEQLQVTNPEEALKKLEEIEQVRAEERASLRHRSTGKWAQNKQVRAKYDKESRQALAQQLRVSRELTQKVKASGDSESEEEVADHTVPSKTNDNNPWTNPIKTSAEVQTFLSGYRKFWEEESKKKKIDDIDLVHGTQLTRDDNATGSKLVKNDINTEESIGGEVNEKLVDDKIKVKPRRGTNNVTASNSNKFESKKGTLDQENAKKNSNVGKTVVSSKEYNETDLQKPPKRAKCVNKKDKSKKLSEPKEGIKNEQKNGIKTNKKYIGTSEWDVSIVSSDTNSEDEIDTIFDNFESRILKAQQELQNKQKKTKEKLQETKHKQKRKQQNETKDKKKQNTLEDLSFPQHATRPVIDEELTETSAANVPDSLTNPSSLLLKSVLNKALTNESTTSHPPPVNNIDPENIIKTTAVNLNTAIPDLLTLDENEEDTDQRGTISEAFEDDDVLEEFKKAKQDEIDGDKPKDVNLALPGWGSWGGTGIKPFKRKNRRFILKFPKQFKRRDENKGNLIINENADAKIKPHLVSEIPFPFKGVKDFEASVRAPIGSTFVPENACRRMIKPAVRTKRGKIIEPIDEEILLKKKK